MTFEEIVGMIVNGALRYNRRPTPDEIIRCATDIYIQQMKREQELRGEQE